MQRLPCCLPSAPLPARCSALVPTPTTRPSPPLTNSANNIIPEIQVSKQAGQCGCQHVRTAWRLTPMRVLPPWGSHCPPAAAHPTSLADCSKPCKTALQDLRYSLAVCDSHCPPPIPHPALLQATLRPDPATNSAVPPMKKAVLATTSLVSTVYIVVSVVGYWCAVGCAATPPASLHCHAGAAT